ncbi:hypothetical protein Tco_1272441 [Tanacetum coccineum]
MAQDNGYAFVEVQEDGTKTICIDCWFKAQPDHVMSFDTRPKPDRESMPRSSKHKILGGLAGGSVATGTITIPEAIDNCMSQQCTDSSEDETDPPATHGTRSPTSKSLTKDDIGSSEFNIYEMTKGCFVWSVRYRVDTDDFITLLPEGWSIRSTVWRIVLVEREDDSLLVINLSGKVVQYNLISKTLYDIFDRRSNQFDDNHDNDDELLQQLEAEHNIYEFIRSFTRLNVCLPSKAFFFLLVDLDPGLPLESSFIRGSLKKVMIRAFIRGMATFEVLNELIEITGLMKLHKRMWFWFVQEIAKEEGLLKFLRERCDDLRRKITRHRVLIHEMEALGDHRVAVDSLQSLKQTHARETAKLAGLTDVMAKTLVGIYEKEGHMARLDLND